MQWFREDLIYHTCYQNQAELIQQVQLFQQRLDRKPLDIAVRFWVKSHLDPEEEKLWVSSYAGFSKTVNGFNNEANLALVGLAGASDRSIIGWHRFI
jgi:ABC-type oligopeptide transport system substrate-binding subunit